MSHKRLDMKHTDRGFIKNYLEVDPGGDKNYILRYITVYSAVFAILAFLVYLPFLAMEKTMVWETDGMSQHYLVLVYLGKWIREIFSNIFINHSFAIPMWDFHIGSGGDIITTFNYYGLGDPLCVLSVFFPEEGISILYSIIIIARLYLAGLFFSLYCFRMKQNGIGVLLGSFIYVFCGYSIFAGVRHPFFLVPMVFFPLLLLGAERILNRESPVLYITSLFMSLVINFYFTYMMGILTVIYVAVRFFTKVKKHKLRNFTKTFCKFFVFSLIGAMIAAAILLPVLIVFLSNPRSGIARDYKILYDVTYYVSLYSGFMGYKSAGFWTYTGFIPLTVVSLLLLFKRKGKYKYLKILLCIFGGMLLLPIFGKMMNGFAYISNRWIWGVAMMLAFTFVVMYKDLFELSKTEKRYILLSSAIYIISCVFLLNGSSNLSTMAQLMILGVITALLVCGDELPSKYRKRILSTSISLLCIVSIIINSGYAYSHMHMDYTKEFIDSEDIYQMISTTPSGKLSNEQNREFSRYEQLPNSAIRNQSILDGSYGVAYYWSLNDNYIGEFLRDTQAVNYTCYDYLHFNRKTMLNELFAVKYFVSDERNRLVPYGYTYKNSVETYNPDKTMDELTTRYYIFENQYSLPVAFGYSDYMTEDEYYKLNAAEKTEAMMSNVLLTEDVDGYEKNSFVVTSTELESKIKALDGVEIEGNIITTTKDKAKIRLTFTPTSSSELYVDIKGLHHLDEIRKSDVLKLSEDEYEDWESLKFPERYKIKHDESLKRDKENYHITASTKSSSCAVTLSTPGYQNYDGQHDFLMNLCYSDNPRDYIDITFDDAGVYTFEDINVISQPMTNYVSQVNNRREHVIENFNIQTNGFTGDINLDEPQLMFFSVPYSRGFDAYVDGEKVEILRANTWGMALDLDAGQHNIEFRYRTYGSGAGIVISVVGLVCLGAVGVIYSKKKKSFKDSKVNK